jgi:hypothetical protein
MRSLLEARTPAALSPEALPVLRIASVPESHVYVRHVAAENDDGVLRIPDPGPDQPNRSARQHRRRPAMLDPEWIAAHDFEVFHLQLGFDAWSPDDLRAVVNAVHDRGCPFVYTAHDLRNPHHPTRDLHDAQLDVLLGEADAVITLTEGAAEEIERRWNRRARVLPHPHVVDFETMTVVAAARAAGRSSPFRIGLHVESLRPGTDPGAVLPTLVEAVRGLPDAVLQVNTHSDVLCADGKRYDAALASYLRSAEARGDLELHVHDFSSDAELWQYLASLDASVLAHRVGTHSAWLEACRDLGTTVIAPTCGYFAEQGPVHSYVLDDLQFDPDSLVTAVRAADRDGATTPLTVIERREQRADIAASHRRLYRSLL